VRVVLDTNVVVSALLWRGSPYRLLDGIRENSRVQIYSTVVLLEELAEVLARPKAARRLAVIDETAAAVIGTYLEVVELIEPAEVVRVARDPDDDHVLACARAARADLIITGDADLLDLKAFERIPIVSAAEALRRVEAER
jgi:putative PIN family toxin of toxin-antitoxin system